MSSSLLQKDKNYQELGYQKDKQEIIRTKYTTQVPSHFY